MGIYSSLPKLECSQSYYVVLPSPPIKGIIIALLLQFPVSELPATTFFWPKPKWRTGKALEIDFHPMRIIFSYQKQVPFPSFYLCLRILIPLAASYLTKIVFSPISLGSPGQPTIYFKIFLS